jgi:hypothetical protein
MTNEEICFQYNQLKIQDKIENFIDCPDLDDMMHPFLDLETNKMFFQCLSCDYKIFPGISLLEKLEKAVMEVTS